MNRQIKIQVLTKKDNYFEVMVQAKRVVCCACDGEGTELRGGLKGMVLSEDNLQDEEFCENYFGGAFDVACSECQGKRVVDVVDEEAMSDKMFARYERALIAEQQFRAEEEGERRMGC